MDNTNFEELESIVKIHTNLSDKLQPGDILSETSFVTVLKVDEDFVNVRDTHGNELNIGIDYINSIYDSADHYNDEVKLNGTELIKVLMEHKNTVCSVLYKKADKKKAKRKYLAELTAQANLIDSISMENAEDKYDKIIEILANPLSTVEEGELRLMKGFHKGEVDARGRIKFYDLEDEGKLKLVDPRTIIHEILSNTKYIKK